MVIRSSSLSFNVIHCHSMSFNMFQAIWPKFRVIHVPVRTTGAYVCASVRQWNVTLSTWTIQNLFWLESTGVLSTSHNDNNDNKWQQWKQMRHSSVLLRMTSTTHSYHVPDRQRGLCLKTVHWHSVPSTGDNRTRIWNSEDSKNGMVYWVYCEGQHIVSHRSQGLKISDPYPYKGLNLLGIPRSSSNPLTRVRFAP